MKIARIFSKLIRLFTEDLSLFIHRKRNKNKDITIISRDCIGGVVYNQYGLRFLSPTINLYFEMDDFNLFCNNLTDYLNGHFEEFKDPEKYFPIGMLIPHSNSLKPIKVFFMHYDNYSTAIEKWNERKKRVNTDDSKIFIINNCTNKEDVETMSKQTITEFNKIKYKKVIFVDNYYGFENEFKLDPIKEYHRAYVLDKKRLSWKRVINNYDFNHFLNE